MHGIYRVWLSKRTGKRYRLPSEAEWEFAARSGGKNDMWAGTSDEKKLADYAVFGALESYAWSRKPNGLGLYDMSGNVSEWVEDCWHPNYNDAPSDGRAWKEENGGQCGQRVVRGGSWIDVPMFMVSSFRNRIPRRHPRLQVPRLSSRPGHRITAASSKCSKHSNLSSAIRAVQGAPPVARFNVQCSKFNDFRIFKRHSTKEPLHTDD